MKQRHLARDIYFATKAQNQQISVPLFNMAEKIRVQPDAAGQDETLTIQTASGPMEFPYTHTTERHKGREFSRFRVRGKITFLKSGPLRAEGAKMVAQLVSGRRRGGFGMSRSFFKPYQVIDRAVDISVEALPLKGKPKTFTGAVGEAFSIAVDASKRLLKLASQ